jgi:hypothetical protein
MFVRALVRSGTALVYSRGFNPRPKISMPLPRVTGLVTLGDILCVTVDGGFEAGEGFCDCLSQQLPGGCDITGLELYQGRKKYQPGSADYLLFPEAETLAAAAVRMDELLKMTATGQQVVIDRTYGSTKPNKKIVVGDYIEDGNVEGDCLRIKCKITPGGTIRYTEIMGLLGVGAETLAEPVVRENIKWVNV